MDEPNKISQEEDVIQTEEGLIFNPFNQNNIEITLNDVQSILKSYGLPVEVYNLNLYKRAFIHRSYTKRPIVENEKNNITIVEQPEDCLPLKTKSNERLEFLGDGILEAITKYYLYKRFPKENQGFMTEKKIALVKNEAIGKHIYEMKLNKWLIISKHAEEKKTRTNLKKLGCLFEAFLGALFLDKNKIDLNDDKNFFQDLFLVGPGFQMAQIFIENVFEKHVDWIELLNNDDNYKNLFQVKVQKEFKKTPDYIEIDYDSETGYSMGVFICLGQAIYEVQHTSSIPYKNFGNFQKIHEYMESNNNVLILMGKGTHKIKKKAEQLACEEALRQMEV